MKRISWLLFAFCIFSACNNAGDQSGELDSSSTIILPEDRSSDSLAMPQDSSRQATDSTGNNSSDTGRTANDSIGKKP